MLRALYLVAGCAMWIVVVAGGPPDRRWHSIVAETPNTWTELPSSDMAHWMMYEGACESKSEPYRVLSFKGTTKLQAGAKLFAFFTKDSVDSALVERFLKEGSLKDWKVMQADSTWGKCLKPGDNLVETEVYTWIREHKFFDNVISIRLVSDKSPDLLEFRHLTLVDETNKVVDRLVAPKQDQ